MKPLLFCCSLLFLVACKPSTDSSRLVIAAEGGKLAIADSDGSVLWEHPITQVHDLHLLENGNILINNGWTKVMELGLDGTIAWQYYSSQTEGYNGEKIEIHAFQRLENGNTMIAES